MHFLSLNDPQGLHGCTDEINSWTKPLLYAALTLCEAEKGFQTAGSSSIDHLGVSVAASSLAASLLEAPLLAGSLGAPHLTHLARQLKMMQRTSASRILVLGRFS